MKQIIGLIIGGCLLLEAGCAAHYYRLNADIVNLYLRMPDARCVNILTSLDNFSPHRAEKINADTWKITVPATREFRYFYTVDGSVYLPECKSKEKDDFGTENCIFVPQM
ncbi:MAG: hypothetical protein WAL98_10040 [Desulfatiglandaceae bacterium]